MLPESVITAHGGQQRWNQYRTLTARYQVGGPFWAFKGRPGFLGDELVVAGTQQQKIRFTRQDGEQAGRVIEFGNDTRHVRVTGADGALIAERTDPRASFAGLDSSSAWDVRQVAYFISYATWHYRTEPFLFTYPACGPRRSRLGRARPDLARPAGDVPGVAGDPQPETAVLLRRHRHAAAHDLPARGQRLRPDRPLHIRGADLRRDRRPHPAAHPQPPPGPHRRPLLHPDHARQADVRALPFAGAFDLAVSFGALGHFLPAERPALFTGVWRALRPGGVFAFPVGAPQPATSIWYWALLGFDLAMQVRNAVWRPPFVMYYAPARCMRPPRPDSIRIHRDDPPLDGSGPARGRQPGVPACPRAQSQHALTAAYALTVRSETEGCAAAEHSDPDARIIRYAPSSVSPQWISRPHRYGGSRAGAATSARHAA